MWLTSSLSKQSRKFQKMNSRQKKTRVLMKKRLKSQQKITSHFLPSSSRSSIKKYKPNNVKQKAFHKTLGEWVVSSLRPFIIVEDVKFREHGYNYESPNQSYFS